MDLAEIGLGIKVKRAAQLLLLKSHRLPGVKGWELKRSVGADYVKVLKALDSYLEQIGLSIKVVDDLGNVLSFSDDESKLSTSRFYVTLRDPLRPSEVRTAGWSIDELAGLTVSLASLISRGGKANRKDVEDVLSEKFPNWKAQLHLSRYVKAGYLREEGETLTLGWRTYAEIDVDKFMQYVLGAK